MRLQVLILGYGEMGHALEYLLADRHDVRIWSRASTTRLETEVACSQIILFCLPVNAHLEVLQRIASFLPQDCLCLSIAKGLDESGMTAAQVFAKTLTDQHRYGVIYGPMISEEIRLGRYAFADVALSQPDDFTLISTLFKESKLVCRQVSDMSGSSWSVILKNVYAIMFGVSDELGLGDNMRGHLIVTALLEISTILKHFGGNERTPYSYAGLGDLLTTATSEDSHHHELGRKLASGQFDKIKGEGVHTLKMVEKYKVFEFSAYPLFTLIHDIIAKPEKLKPLVDAYMLDLKKW